MKTKQIAIVKKERNLIHDFLDELFEKCYIDALTGKFHCKLCNNVVHIDLSKKIVYCSVHGMLI
jgi:hypothetical protein